MAEHKKYCAIRKKCVGSRRRYIETGYCVPDTNCAYPTWKFVDLDRWILTFRNWCALGRPGKPLREEGRMLLEDCMEWDKEAGADGCP